MPEPWKDDDPMDQARKQLEASTQQLGKLFGMKTPEQLEQERREREAAIVEGELQWGQLAAYVARTRCAKCGHGKISSRYVDPNDMPPGQYLPVFFYRKCGMHEATMRGCDRCGYCWFEKPLNLPRLRPGFLGWLRVALGR